MTCQFEDFTSVCLVGTIKSLTVELAIRSIADIPVNFALSRQTDDFNIE